MSSYQIAFSYIEPNEEDIDKYFLKECNKTNRKEERKEKKKEVLKDSIFSIIESQNELTKAEEIKNKLNKDKNEIQHKETKNNKKEAQIVKNDKNKKQEVVKPIESDLVNKSF